MLESREGQKSLVSDRAEINIKSMKMLFIGKY